MRPSTLFFGKGEELECAQLDRLTEEYKEFVKAQLQLDRLTEEHREFVNDFAVRFTARQRTQTNDRVTHDGLAFCRDPAAELIARAAGPTDSD